MRRLFGFNWGHFEQELKVGFNLSADVVSMAFSGLTGRVLGGGYKQLQGCRCGFMAVAPECLLFYGLVLGLLMVLLCTVPSRFEDLITRLLVAKVYKPLVPYLALLLLILASVVAAEDMLRINNASFVCFGIVAAAFVGTRLDMAGRGDVRARLCASCLRARRGTVCMRVCVSCVQPSGSAMCVGASRQASTRWLRLVRAMWEEGLARVCRRGRGSLMWWRAQRKAVGHERASRGHGESAGRGSKTHNGYKSHHPSLCNAC